ncbi:hypothetical protein [Lysobacter capsici]|uniref:hypothetical protein n=1 Tax=Lysobacter capsici TaxID=435897 RepID=UPI0007164C19|nr:hypothetical protein [Lysobacter capsici]
MLGLSEPDLAIALEIPERVIRLQPDDASVQKKLGSLADLFDRLLELNPDAATAARHMKNIRIRVLANRTLLEAVKDNESEKALRYLKSISGGQSG